jgi:uncharacterized iron-regulated membrane protein
MFSIYQKNKSIADARVYPARSNSNKTKFKRSLNLNYPNSMRKILKKLHLYLAITLCIPLVLQGITGLIMVFQHEISNYQLHTKHVFASGEIQAPSKIIISALTQVPEGSKVNSIKLPIAEKSPAVVRLTKKIEEKKSIFEVVADPVSLEIIEVKNPENDFFKNLKKFHSSLFIPGQTGKNIVGTFGLVMLFMVISGLVIWWPKKITFKRAMTFKFSSTGKQFHRDLHSAVGFWTSLIIFITSFAGVYLAFTPQTTATILAIFPGKDLKKSANEMVIDPGSSFLTIDELADFAAQKVSSDDKLLSINFPMKPEQPFRINFVPKNYEDGEPIITVFIDQYWQRILEVRDPKNYSLGEKIIAWQHSIHAGEGLGYLWKITVFLTGFLPLLFSITGISLWLIKRKSKKLKAA